MTEAELREKQEEIETLQSEIKALEEKRGELQNNIWDAERAIEQWSGDYNRWFSDWCNKMQAKYGRFDHCRQDEGQMLCVAHFGPDWMHSGRADYGTQDVIDTGEAWLSGDIPEHVRHYREDWTAEGE